MKKIIYLLLVLLFIIGCNNISQRGQQASVGQVANIENYRTGSDGLIVKQAINMPPSIVYLGEDFKIGLEIKNQGASDVTGAKVKLFALNPLYFNPASAQSSVDLTGRSRVYPSGDIKIVEFDIKSTSIPYGSKKYNAKYEVQIEYPYTTTAGADVCINPNIYEHLKIVKDVCTLPSESSLSSQGGPVGVTKIKEYSSSRSDNIYANYDITVKNIGNGDVVDKIVRIEDAVISNKELECNKNELILKDKEAKFRCSIPIKKSEGVYKSLLSIKLLYNYKSTFQGDLQVIK